MQSKPGVPAKYRILASLVPLLALMTLASTIMLFRWRSRYSEASAERRGRTRALLHLEGARELVDRAEKYARLPLPADAGAREAYLRDIEEMAAEAVNRATQALASGGNLEDAFRTRGRALEVMYNFDEARKDYEDCIRLYRASPARLRLGALLTRQIARARLAEMKTVLGDLNRLRSHAIEHFHVAVNPPPELTYEVDVKDRFTARTCVRYLGEDFKDLAPEAKMAALADATEWLPLYLRGLAHYENKDLAAAAKDLEAAARAAPAVADPRAWLGVVYHELGRSTEGIDELTLALEANGHFLEAYWARGRIYFATERFGQAREDFAKCAELRPSMPGIHLKHGTAAYETWHRTGRIRAADLEEAEASLGKHLEASPQDHAALLLRARVRLARNDHAGAEADLTAALASPADPADALLLRAQAFEAQKQYARAEADYTAAIEKTGDAARAADARRRRARVRVRTVKPEEALEDYAALLARDPNDLSLYLEKGGLELLCGKPDAASATVEKALALGRNARLLSLRAEIALKKEDWAAAHRDAADAFALDPQLADALVVRGKAFLGQGRKAEALEEWRKALERRPDLAEELEPWIRRARP